MRKKFLVLLLLSLITFITLASINAATLNDDRDIGSAKIGAHAANIFNAYPNKDCAISERPPNPVAVPQSSNAQPSHTAAAEEEWYLPTEDKAAQLYVYEVGSGEPVVVLHGGFGAEHSYLLDAVKGLESQFRFIFYDQRGSLRSPCKVEDISIEKHVQDLETLRQALGLERIKMFAHSAGTLLAMHYLQKYPQRVMNLALVGAVYPKNGVKYFTAEELKLSETRTEEFKRFLERPEVSAELEKAGVNHPNLTAKQQTYRWRINFAAANLYHVERWRQMKGGRIFYNEPAGQAAVKTIPQEYDFSAALANHPYPLTVINGAYDLLVDIRPDGLLWKKLHATEVRNMSLVIIDKAAHCLWVDEPDVFRNELKKALKKTR